MGTLVGAIIWLVPTKSLMSIVNMALPILGVCSGIFNCASCSEELPTDVLGLLEEPALLTGPRSPNGSF